MAEQPRAYIRSPSGEPERITTEDGSYVELGYDPALRVESEDYFDAGGAPLDAQAYTFDVDGNRETHTEGGVTKDYSYLAGAMLAAIALGGSPIETFEYDDAGRTTSLVRAGADYALGYDPDGNVIRIDDRGAPVAEYAFDGEGQREQITHGGVTRRYLVAPILGDGLAGPHAVVDDLGVPVAMYVYSGQQPLMRIGAGGAVTYYLEDDQGSVIGLADGAGALTGSFAYDGFGNLRSAAGSESGLPADTLGDFRFHGMWLDPTGLYFVRARTYDPETGRFLSRDPAAGQFGQPETFAAYAYATGNPFVWSDPTGMFAATLKELGAATAILAQNVGRAFAGLSFLRKLQLAAKGIVLIHSIVSGGHGGPSEALTVDTGLVALASGAGPMASPVWGRLQPHRGRTRTNGRSGRKKRFYEWDFTHGDIEEYDHLGRHLGTIDPKSGERTKPAVRGRKIKT